MLAPAPKRQKPCPASCFQNAEQGFCGSELEIFRRATVCLPEPTPVSPQEYSPEPLRPERKLRRRLPSASPGTR